MEMNDEQLLRYSRQIMLPAIGIEGQQRLLESHALIIGLGGLGSPVALYLAAAGVGRLSLVDHDSVELSNLQRQIAHQSSSIGNPKVISAKHSAQALNPETVIDTYAQRADASLLAALVPQVDIVIDATDNFAVRFAINKACIDSGTPMVMGAAIRMEGQVSVFQPAVADSPCYRCLYQEGDEPEQTCSETGVLSPVVGLIGSIQAIEAIKVLTGSNETLTGKLLIIDALTMEFRRMILKKDACCPVCAGGQSVAE